MRYHINTSTLQATPCETCFPDNAEVRCFETKEEALEWINLRLEHLCELPNPARHLIASSPAPTAGDSKKLAVIESPLAGDFEKNRAYAIAACRDSLLTHGEAPYASHLFYTQMLDDEKKDERDLGIMAGFEWGSRSDIVVVYVDLGISRGMMLGVERALRCGTPVLYRSIPDWQDRETTKTAAF